MWLTIAVINSIEVRYLNGPYIVSSSSSVLRLHEISYYLFFSLYMYFLLNYIVDLQCCAKFCCTAKWPSQMYIYILFLISSPSCSIPRDQTQLPALYSRTPLKFTVYIFWMLSFHSHFGILWHITWGVSIFLLTQKHYFFICEGPIKIT